jgi:hypothetical protein
MLSAMRALAHHHFALFHTIRPFVLKWALPVSAF